MAIKKRIQDDKVVYDIAVKIRDENGKQIYRTRRGIPSEREAKRLELEFRYELMQRKNKTLWSNWIEHFLERYRIEFRNSTYLNYKKLLEKWINPVWNDKNLEDITPTDVHDLVFNHIQNVSSHHRQSLLKIIKRVFGMALEDGLITRNPASSIRVRVAEANQQVLNSKEIAILLREAKSIGHRFYPHWCLAILTGMRSGELLALRWTDIDFVNGLIRINKSWTRWDGEGPTKTAKNRICPMSSECGSFLQELKLKTGNIEYVLPQLEEWKQGQQARALREFCTGIGITPVKFHDLRATFITQMLNNGVALSKVMAIVGHSSLKTTQGYLRLSGKDVEGATEKLGVKIPRDTPHEMADIIPFRKL